MITQEKVQEVLGTLKVGEGFEVGDLFHRLPADEKIYWLLCKITNKNKNTRWRFKLFYRGVFLRHEELKVVNGKLERFV